MRVVRQSLKRLASLFNNLLRFPRFQNLLFSLQQHLLQRFKARPHPGDLANIEMHRALKFRFCQLAHIAKREHVLERG